jgi:small subunit ribosomal protein S19
MGRSLKKGFCVDLKLVARADEASKRSSTRPIRTWSRRSIISPDFVGLNFEVHNGKSFLLVHITENMVGHRLGEFAPTRTFKGHNPHTQK